MADDPIGMIAPAAIVNPAAVQVDEVPLAPPQGDGAEAAAIPAPPAELPPPEQVQELDRYYAGVPAPAGAVPDVRPGDSTDPDAAETLNALAVALVLGGHSVADHLREMSAADDAEEQPRGSRKRRRDRRQD